jgi:hypothetical protein
LFEVLQFGGNGVEVFDEVIKDVLEEETGVVGERGESVGVVNEGLNAVLNLLVDVEAVYFVLFESLNPG